MKTSHTAYGNEGVKLEHVQTKKIQKNLRGTAAANLSGYCMISRSRISLLPTCGGPRKKTRNAI